ncbi:hypothetical protein CYMTET_12606 [Cymbomonas tetramitiformis]|uniref:Uncharacterized protein n=1 Tax=Cymbomonas tetramitiformis TaxID=36881 RepID=A0AAE0LBP0_9CHLO|nr:hypothetical protein CYMTET_12606 [Cymbomonas tetramitiformis]
METLKKLRRLAKPNNCCFSFDLQDGCRHMGINPAYQECNACTSACGGRYFSAALSHLGGWKDYHRIFVKVMKGLADTRSAYIGQARSAADWREGVLVLPCMDDFHVLASIKVEALIRAQNLANRGTAKRFRVTPARLQQIHQKATALLGQASLPVYIVYNGTGLLDVGLDRRGMVPQATDSEPVERAEYLAEPHEGQGMPLDDWHLECREVNWINRLWLLMLGKGSWMTATELSVQGAALQDAVGNYRPKGQSAEGSTERSHWRLLWKRGRLKSAQANDWVQLALTQLGCVPP